MNKYIKEFLLSTAYIWVYYFLVVRNGGFTSAKETVEGSFLFFSFFFPVFVLIVVIIPAIYIYFILRKKEQMHQKGFLYFILSWVLFWGLINGTVPVATWIQNQVFFGGQGEEHKQTLLLRAEKSIEEKLNQELELVEVRYTNRGSFSNVAFYLDFKEEGCHKDCPTKLVYLSYEEQGWRIKIINGQIWYFEE